MIEIPMKTKGAIDRNTIGALNGNAMHQSASANPFHTTTHAPSPAPTTAAPPPKILTQSLPPLKHPIQKGQKVPIGSAPLHSVMACFGWNANHPQCDVDVSAFLLGANAKVPGDDWFVFYGQTESPDKSTVLQMDAAPDRERITIDLDRLDPAITRIVFVLTINEALEKNLNFSMLKDAYVRLLSTDGKTEFVSFQIKDYYANIISMMIGELYLHNGAWKFGSIGNGIAKDLAGLCAFYGVQVSE